VIAREAGFHHGGTEITEFFYHYLSALCVSVVNFSWVKLRLDFRRRMLAVLVFQLVLRQG